MCMHTHVQAPNVEKRDYFRHPFQYHWGNIRRYIVHIVTRVILHGVLHDVMRGDVIGANQDVFQVVFDVPIRVANRSGTTRQVHVDFDFVSTNVNLLNWLLCTENEELEEKSQGEKENEKQQQQQQLRQKQQLQQQLMKTKT